MSEYSDDPSIDCDELLYRRVKLSVDLIIFDPSVNKLRPTSTAFKNTIKILEPYDATANPEPERVETYMSVFIHGRLLELSLAASDALEGVEDFVLVQLNAGTIRAVGESKGAPQFIFHAPEPPPPPCMEAHGGVSGKKTKSVRNELSNRAVWIVRPSVEWVLKNRSTLRIPDDLEVERDFDSLFA